MCIISVKMKGADFPPKNIIENCMDSNPDGFAMAWNIDGDVRTFRTMDREKALAMYESLAGSLDPATTGLVFHARIATHGSKRVENCHCFREDDIVFNFKGEECRASLAFAHNGILRNVPARDDLTDSETFFRDWFLPVLKTAGWESAHSLAKAVIGASKFAFITNNGNIELIGDYLKEAFPGCKGKIYFSNMSYVPKPVWPASRFSPRKAATASENFLPIVGSARQTGHQTHDSLFGASRAESEQTSLWGRNTVLYNNGDGNLHPENF